MSDKAPENQQKGVGQIEKENLKEPDKPPRSYLSLQVLWATICARRLLIMEELIVTELATLP
jgi:hypothetical protein